MVQCPECDKLFTRQSSLNRHVTSTHGKAGTGHECTRCDKTFARFDNLERHKKRFHSAAVLTCSSCFRRFRRIELYEKHQNACQRKTMDATATSSGEDSMTVAREPWKLDNDTEAPAAGTRMQGRITSSNSEFAAQAGIVEEASTMQPLSFPFDRMSFMDYDIPLASNDMLNYCIDFDEDIPFNFVDDLNEEIIEQLLEDLVGSDSMGQIAIEHWPSKTHPPVSRQLKHSAPVKIVVADSRKGCASSLPQCSNSDIETTASWYPN